MIVYAKHVQPDSIAFYRCRVTPAFAERHNNYCLVSIGWNIGVDLPIKSFEYLKRTGRAVQVTADEWNHSGCQSACKLRGAYECRW